MKAENTNAPPGSTLPVLPKSPTGIRGLDEITGGGLPTGRPTLICGAAGCGKTLLAMQFVLHGATELHEPAVFMAFEETSDDLAENVASLGFDLRAVIARHELVVDTVVIERHENVEAGDFDLEGLFIRLGHAIDSIGAKRVVLDTLEALFSDLPNPTVLRAELRRLFRWLKTKGVTTVVTAERGDGTLTRHGIEEYVADCVIELDNRVVDQVPTRRLRVLKYRGSTHGNNEYPFLIDKKGISIFPVTSLALDYETSNERVSSGIGGLDAMLGGPGYYRASSILVTGTTGSGKTTLAAHFAAATCQRGERCLYFLFEESQSQMIRNMRSVGLDLEPWVEKGLLRFHSVRPSGYGLEMHLAKTLQAVDDFQPQAVILDPMSSFTSGGNDIDVKTMILRLVDFLKARGITMFLLSLTKGNAALEHTDVEVSSLADTWVLLRDIETSGERNRLIYVLKSRGMAHSNQVREFILTGEGVSLADAYVGPEGVLTGSARVALEAREAADQRAALDELERQQLILESRRQIVEHQVATLHAEFAMEEARTVRMMDGEAKLERQRGEDRRAMEESRGVNGPNKGPAPSSRGRRRGKQ